MPKLKFKHPPINVTGTSLAYRNSVPLSQEHTFTATHPEIHLCSLALRAHSKGVAVNICSLTPSERSVWSTKWKAFSWLVTFCSYIVTHFMWLEKMLSVSDTPHMTQDKHTQTTQVPRSLFLSNSQFLGSEIRGLWKNSQMPAQQVPQVSVKLWNAIKFSILAHSLNYWTQAVSFRLM